MLWSRGVLAGGWLDEMFKVQWSKRPRLKVRDDQRPTRWESTLSGQANTHRGGVFLVSSTLLQTV
jgi:hypothetical protein